MGRLVMMVVMMLPSLVPMLSQYHRSVGGVDGIHRHGLTALVCVGYFVVWAQWLPVAAGVVILVAGGVQFTSWKARQLLLWREGSGCGRRPRCESRGWRAWRSSWLAC